MSEKPRFYGTKTGKIIETIIKNSLHTWSDIQKETGFSEREQNYHLAQLFQQGFIVKERGEYYVTPNLEAEWNEYYKQLEPPDTPLESHTSSVEGMRLGISRKSIVVILLLLSLIFNVRSYVHEYEISSQNAALQSEIDQYEALIEELESNIESLETQLEQAQKTKDNLLNEISRLNSLIQESQENPSAPEDGSSSSSSSTSSSSREVSIERVSYCTYVLDGDTLYLPNGDKVRLADIDAPDSDEYGWEESREALIDLVFGKQVYVDIDRDPDIYGRLVCVIYVSQGSGYVNVNNALVIDGFAEVNDYDNEFSPSQWALTEILDITEAVFDQEGFTSDSDNGSDSSSDSSSYSGPFWGSKNSNIYHKPSCYWAQQISPLNLIVFNSRSAAEAAGYRPCQVCKP